MTVIAEGIETQEQLARLRHLAVSSARVLFSPAVPKLEVAAISPEVAWPGAETGTANDGRPSSCLEIGLERFGHSDAAHRDRLGSGSPLRPAAVPAKILPRPAL